MSWPERRKAGTTHGKEQVEPLRAAVRLASGDDIARAAALRVEEEEARRVAVQRARALNLEMKVSDAEWQFDRRRLTFYFTAEERIDFRALVRQLETHFGVRVQMWHIGPRDEAKRLDGVGHCGRQLCSSSWLPELLPVKTSLAKEQRLSTITPTQISGACGRLMCCLRYEHEFYVQARKRFPKHGKIVQTLQGDEKVDATDIFRDLVTLRSPDGELRTIPLAQFKRELAGDSTLVPDDALAEENGHDEEDEGDARAPASAPARALMTQLQRGQPSAGREPQARGLRERGESRGGESRGGRQQRRAARARAWRPNQRPNRRLAGGLNRASRRGLRRGLNRGLDGLNSGRPPRAPQPPAPTAALPDSAPARALHPRASTAPCARAQPGRGAFHR